MYTQSPETTICLLFFNQQIDKTQQGEKLKNTKLTNKELIGVNIKKSALKGAILCHTITPSGEDYSGCKQLDEYPTERTFKKPSSYKADKY